MVTAPSIPQDGKYSATQIRARRNPDGSMRPATAPRRARDGSFQRPAGRTRIGMIWDGRAGLWRPDPHYVSHLSRARVVVPRRETVIPSGPSKSQIAVAAKDSRVENAAKESQDDTTAGIFRGWLWGLCNEERTQAGTRTTNQGSQLDGLGPRMTSTVCPPRSMPTVGAYMKGQSTELKQQPQSQLGSATASDSSKSIQFDNGSEESTNDAVARTIQRAAGKEFAVADTGLPADSQLNGDCAVAHVLPLDDAGQPPEQQRQDAQSNLGCNESNTSHLTGTVLGSSVAPDMDTHCLANVSVRAPTPDCGRDGLLDRLPPTSEYPLLQDHVNKKGRQCVSVLEAWMSKRFKWHSLDGDPRPALIVAEDVEVVQPTTATLVREVVPAEDDPMELVRGLSMKVVQTANATLPSETAHREEEPVELVRGLSMAVECCFDQILKGTNDRTKVWEKAKVRQ
jgi:hypothetical protein